MLYQALAEVDKWSFPDFVLAIYVRNKAGFGPILMGASELPSASTRPTIPLLLAAVAAGIAVDWSAPHPHHQIKGMIDVVNARKEQWASDIETRGEEVGMSLRHADPARHRLLYRDSVGSCV